VADAVTDPLAALVAAADRETESVNVDQSAATFPMIVFRAGGLWYAVPVAQVREVVARDQIARVPGVSRHILGIALVHSRLVPVLDVAILLVRGVSRPRESARLVLLELEDSEIALLAEEARGVVDLPAPTLARGRRVELVAGEVYWNDDLVYVLDAPALVESVTGESTG
jgi:purine-binding chemotaxis protein CheW